MLKLFMDKISHKDLRKRAPFLLTVLAASLPQNRQNPQNLT
jgi:hypothetical protein